MKLFAISLYIYDFIEFIKFIKTMSEDGFDWEASLLHDKYLRDQRERLEIEKMEEKERPQRILNDEMNRLQNCLRFAPPSKTGQVCEWWGKINPINAAKLDRDHFDVKYERGLTIITARQVPQFSEK